MALTFECSHCAKDVTVRHLKVGEEVRCPFCGAYGVVPADARPAADSQVSSVKVAAGHGATPVAEAPKTAAPHPYLASRGRRFWGYLIDYAVLVISMGLIFGVAGLSARATPVGIPGQAFNGVYDSPVGALISLVVIAYIIVQAVMLMRRGQTVGKWIVRTRIVTMDGEHPSWWRLVLVRPLIIVGAMTRPGIQWAGGEWGQLVRLAFGGLFLLDALFVLNSDRRALHDHLAGTQVVDPKALLKHRLGQYFD